MPLTNWPPASAPAWPPAELHVAIMEFSDWETMLRTLQKLHAAGWSQAAPTTAERTQFFTGVTCSHDHNVTGRMLLSPLGVRYPFAVCNNGSHREVLVLWAPYSLGPLSSTIIRPGTLGG